MTSSISFCLVATSSVFSIVVSGLSGVPLGFGEGAADAKRAAAVAYAAAVVRDGCEEGGGRELVEAIG